MINKLPQHIADILASKGLTEQSSIENYLYPQLSRLQSPFTMLGMERAVEMVLGAMDCGQPIMIWGDYDVDGTTGTALLINFFRALDVAVEWYVPNRMTEGYGLNVAGFIGKFGERLGAGFLLVTVDCGISNGAEIKEIISLGGEVIVTDHHQLPLADCPECVVLNPHQPSCGFFGEDLAGVGVAFYLAAAIRSRLTGRGYFDQRTSPNMKEYLGFVALGSLADLVPISSTNRILIRAGLEALIETNLPGLQALLTEADICGTMITSEDIGFNLGPKINAAGRMGSAAISVELLTSADIEHAGRLSKKLSLLNKKRKEVCAQDLETALGLVHRHVQLDAASIVISGTFHPGVVGIIAAKLVEQFGKPTIVLTNDKTLAATDRLKGSGRSIEGVNLVEALGNCRGYVEKFGGHACAAGLSLRTIGLAAFTDAFERAVQMQVQVARCAPATSLLWPCRVDEVMAKENLSYFRSLEPFGPGNERPIFLDLNAELVTVRVIGSKAEHLQLLVRGKFQNYRGVGFGLGHKYPQIYQSAHCRLQYSPTLNRYRGGEEWQLQVYAVD